MVGNTFEYLPAFKGFYNLPLGRYLPPLPRGVAADWLEANTQPGDLVLDPLGANPMVAVEAASISRRVLFARNNPAIWLILEALASAPSEIQIRSTVSKLLLSRQMNTTLDSYLQSIYATICMECGSSIQPLGFIWENNALMPSGKVYTCPNCGDSGERAISEEDIHNFKRLGKIDLQRTRAFQRVMQGGDYEKESIEAALDCYLPRAIFVTMLVVNRLDGLVLDIKERKLLQAIMLTFFDDATSLWHWPEKDHRYLQLTVPSRFIEKNLWLCLDRAHENWAYSSKPVAVSYWPKLPPPEGGICLFQRILADQKTLLESEKPAAIFSVYPRPNQAFWTLSALWSGWLWGRKGVIPMRSALLRRRYDWHWFTQAISASIGPFISNLSPETRVFGLFPQVSPNFYLGLQAGLCIAGYELVGAAFRPVDDLVQCQWKLAGSQLKIQDIDFKNLIAEFLKLRGEPASFKEIVLNCLTEIALEKYLPTQADELNESLFSQIQEQITAILRDTLFIEPLRNTLTGGSLWFLRDSGLSQPPLSERVEKAIRNLLLEAEPVNNRDLERIICKQFCGSLTPQAELIHLCLESYADPISSDNHRFFLQPEERQASREKDLEQLHSILSESANKLGAGQEIDED